MEILHVEQNIIRDNGREECDEIEYFILQASGSIDGCPSDYHHCPFFEFYAYFT